MRILIVEDNEKLAKSLKQGLEQEGFVADYLLDGEKAALRFESSSSPYDALVLDLMLPKKDGMTLCRELRQNNNSIPILMLTAKDTLSDRVMGLNSGADDYVVKPFALDEIIARLHALLRRPKKVFSEVLSIENITLNPLTKHVTKGGKKIILTQKEFSILEYMMRNPGNVMTRQEIIDHVWEYDFTPFSNLVDAKIKNLRKKIDPDNILIETVRGSGYRLRE